MARRNSWSCACAVALVLSLLQTEPGGAAERTFVWSPRDLVTAVDDFNAEVMEYAPLLGKGVRIRGGALALGGARCPSLTVEAGRVLTRVRLLDGPARAALVAGRRPNGVLGDALSWMGGVLWFAPASGKVRQPFWVAQPVSGGIAEFATSGYATGGPLGALTATGGGDDDKATFLARVSVHGSIGTRQTEIVLALTTETRTRSGRRPRRTECFLLLPVEAADVQALVALLAATPLADTTRSRLSESLTRALYWLENEQPQRAARNVKRFAGDVSSLSVTEMPVDAGEAMVRRAVRVMEALEF